MLRRERPSCKLFRERGLLQDGSCGLAIKYPRGHQGWEQSYSPICFWVRTKTRVGLAVCGTVENWNPLAETFTMLAPRAWRSCDLANGDPAWEFGSLQTSPGTGTHLEESTTTEVVSTLQLLAEIQGHGAMALQGPDEKGDDCPARCLLGHPWGRAVTEALLSYLIVRWEVWSLF